MIEKAGFGGGCHWCTEAVFASLRGVERVEQGWIAPAGEEVECVSEAVIVHFDPVKIPRDILVEIHLRTHNATSDHSMREKYRSAVYTFSKEQYEEMEAILRKKEPLFDKPLVTRVYPFGTFRPNSEKYQNYYAKNPKKPFCQRYIEPKLTMLLEEYERNVFRRQFKDQFREASLKVREESRSIAEDFDETLEDGLDAL